VNAPPSNGDPPREPVYQRIARLVQRWSAHPESQGDDASAVVDAAVTDRGLILVNSSRSILYAHNGPDFAKAAAEAAAELQAALD
jgi:orotidine-5'-phosphate decarboxylase